MTAPVRGNPTDDGGDRVAQAVRLYEQQYRGQEGIDLERYWADRGRQGPLDEQHELACLSKLIKADLRHRFRRGEAPAVSSYLEAFPELRSDDDRMLSLIYEEYCLREDRGDGFDAEAFCDRYPDWKDSLASQLKYHHFLGQAAGLSAPKPPFPVVGDVFEEFALKALIGKGGCSRVFLADDLSLGRKRVVLKVSIDRGLEAEAQGALDHPHIVPVNAVVFQPEHGLRGLSMPLRIGLPLDEVIRLLREGGRRPRSARDVWDALAGGIDRKLFDVSDDDLAAGPAGDGWRGFPVDGAFGQASAWIGLVLANALDYAHSRRTYHRDVKPGNVLLTLHHGPQLLDFNLSESPHSPQLAKENLGGTLPYMAPEQIEAFLAPGRWEGVGALADVYSLGLVLHELLTGQAPALPDPALPPSLAMRDLLDRRAALSTDVRRHDDRIPYALEAIINKCIRQSPNDRYKSGKQLAEDLEAFLERRPLVHAENPSRTERGINWATRNRRMLAANVFYLTILLLLSPLLAEKASRLLQPALKRNSAFQEAVKAVDDEDYSRAVPLLLDVSRSYPEEPLPYIYLGLAYSGAERLPEDPAIAAYTRAAALPGVDDRLREWSREHPPFVGQLRRFGSTSLEKTREVVKLTRTPAGVPANEGRRAMDQAVGRVFEAVDHVFKNVLAAEEGSREAIRGLAIVAEYRKDFATAQRRLTELLEPAGRKAASIDPGEFASLRMQRARAATMRAREEGFRIKGPDLAEAIRIVDEAVADLDACLQSVTDVNRLFYLGYRTETMLTRGELQRARGDAGLALADAREAKKHLELWVALARSSSAPVEGSIESVYRDRIRDVLRNPGGASRQGDASSPTSEPTKPSE